MSEPIIKTRSEKTGHWIKGRDTGGLAQTFSWDNLEGLIRQCGHLRKNELVDRFKIDDNGVTIYIEKE